MSTSEHQKQRTRWGRLDASPKRSRTSKLGRLTSINESPPLFLQPLAAQFEKITRTTESVDDKTGEKKKRKVTEYRLGDDGERIPKPPKEWAFGGWDIESHCYEHVCSAQHQTKPRHQRCVECDECPACNPEHGEHWIAAQLSVLRIPDAYIEYVNDLPAEKLLGGTIEEGGRYVEFLNGPETLCLRERARCIHPGGCIDRTIRFLMEHKCFFQKTHATKGYVAVGKHNSDCAARGNIRKDGKPCPGCLKKPYAPAVHTNKCRYDMRLTREDGTPCPGCATLPTIWYSHFGGGYDINFVLRWLSSNTSDARAVKENVLGIANDAERAEMRAVMEKRYAYRAESLLSGATHIQVKLSKLTKAYKPPKISKLAAPAVAPKKGKDYWLSGFLETGLVPGAPLAEPSEIQDSLNVVMRSKLRLSGVMTSKTEKVLRDFQKKCGLPETGAVDRETSAALRFLKSQAGFEVDPKEVILLRDSFRLVASSLAEAAKDFELRHPVTGDPLTKIDDIDVKNPPPPDDPDFRRYCRIDTEVCVQLVTKFAQLVNQLGGTLEMTSSACAVSLFRRRYLKEKVLRHRHLAGCRMLCPHCGLESCSTECGTNKGRRPGENMAAHHKLLDRHKKRMHRLCPTYPVGCFHFAAIGKNGHRHGGHVDVIRQQLNAGRCYDVNSLYPFAMLGPVPVGPMQRYVNLTPREAKHEKPKSALRSYAGAWRLQKQRTLELASRQTYWRNMVDRHGIEMAALEACYRVGADRGADPETGKPFDDHDFDRIDSFKRIRRCGYVECIVSIPKSDDVPECYFPPLPVVRDSEESGEILFWPSGEAIYGWWCYEELRSLLEVPGARLCAVRQSVWFRGEPLFREFIDTLYTERKRSDGAKKQLLKILMNGSYGKTLQNPLKRRVLRLQRHEERPKGWLPTNPNPPDGDDFNWPWGTIQEYREAPFFLPHWGSLITARARMVIWKICVDVERGKYGKGKHVSYLDTDSCYTTARLEEDSSRLGALKLEYQLDEDKRKKTLGKLDEAWAKYQKRYEENVEKIEADASLSRAEKKELKKRLDARLRYYKEEHYESEKDSPKYARARPEGLVSCEFYGPKLYIVKDPVTGAEVKTVHKGSPEPNSEKLRRFLAGEPIKTKAKAPKAGAGIRDDFQFDPVVLTRTGQKILWKKPKKDEREIMHKRVHHHDPSGDGRTSPRHLHADQEFEVEESFRSRHTSTAAKIYEEWTGALWEEKLASTLEVLATA